MSSPLCFYLHRTTGSFLPPKVIDTGPYAIVRHPVYLGGIFLSTGIPLSSGSFWALVPATVGSLVILVWIVVEEKTLYEELEGYKEYVGRVRYRLIPGIWYGLVGTSFQQHVCLTEATKI
jgi:protein-S-isoprenylcysteine O-methyltransferase Ste14